MAVLGGVARARGAAGARRARDRGSNGDLKRRCGGGKSLALTNALAAAPRFFRCLCASRAHSRVAAAGHQGDPLVQFRVPRYHWPQLEADHLSAAPNRPLAHRVHMLNPPDFVHYTQLRPTVLALQPVFWTMFLFPYFSPTTRKTTVMLWPRPWLSFRGPGSFASSAKETPTAKLCTSYPEAVKVVPDVVESCPIRGRARSIASDAANLSDTCLWWVLSILLLISGACARRRSRLRPHWLRA